MLPHTNLGALSREDLARLREVTASQGLMLESLRDDLVAHQGSPTKDPVLRLQTIRDAQRAADPVHQRDPRRHRRDAGRPRSRRSRRSPRSTRARAPGGDPAELRPAPALLRRGAGGHRDRRRRARTGAPDCGAGPRRRRAGVVDAGDDRGHEGADRATRELMPDVGIQIPPNLADWWPELVAAGATDLGGLSANGDHISPEHPFPSPAPGAQAPRAGRRRPDRAAVHVPAVPRRRVDGAGRARRRQGELLVFIPRGERTRSQRAIRTDLIAGAIAKGRDGAALSADELTALFAEDRPEAIEDLRQARIGEVAAGSGCPHRASARASPRRASHVVDRHGRRPLGAPDGRDCPLSPVRQ